MHTEHCGEEEDALAPLPQFLREGQVQPCAQQLTGSGLAKPLVPANTSLDHQSPGEDKENAAQTTITTTAPTAHKRSEYVKDRVPARSALRKSINPNEDGMQKLLSNFGSLQNQMQQFSQQSQLRRESLTGAAPRPELQTLAGAQLIPARVQEPQASHMLDSAVFTQRAVAYAGDASCPWRPAQHSSTSGNSVLPAASQLRHHAVGPADLHDQDMDDCPMGGGGSGDGSNSSSAPAVVIPAAVASTKYGKAATELFMDAGLQKLCNDGLHRKLQRTKDGATEKSRIQELAELVKLLRKAVRELGSRASMYVEHCAKFDKEHAQQVESMSLSHQAGLKALEAELAATRQSLAQLERDFKSGRAQWGQDLDVHKAEVSRLKRDLERVSEERDKAREEGSRAEAARVGLESEVKDLKRTAGVQAREWTLSQSEAVRHLGEEKAAVEARLASLTDESAKMATTLSAVQACCQEYEQELHLLRAAHDNLHGQVSAKDSMMALQEENAAKLHAEVVALRSQVCGLQADKAGLEEQCSGLMETRSALEAEACQRSQRLAELQCRLEAVAGELEEERTAREQEQVAAQASATSAAEERRALCEEKTILKTALGAALSQKEATEVQLGALRDNLAELHREHTNLHNQVEFAAEAQASAEQRAEAAVQRAEALTNELAASRQEAADKASRLTHLEDEFSTLKEVLGDAGGQKDVVQSLLGKIATLQSAVAAAEATRRRLHNELVEIKGNIRVYCRVRPHDAPAIRCLPDNTSVAVSSESGKEVTFGYDRVFGPGASQEEVFNSVSELVQSALDGYHVCLFSYGQTGAGKTHTMQGSDSPLGRGIIPRSVAKILETARKLQSDQEWEYSMDASFIEVYNNQLRDLLAGPSAPYISDQSAIKHDPDGGHTIVQGVSRVPVTDMEGAGELMRRAAASRAVESTAMNAQSSRSHSAFMLYISGWHAPSSTRLQGCLCLVDLAGSERLDRSLAEDQRKKEACAINQSLSALGDVFAALSAKSSHVPYRNSKLTYLLQPCLGGHGKTLMFVNINPEAASTGESLCSLRFAAKVSGCETGAKGGAKRHVLGPAGGEASGSGSSAGDAGGAKRFSMPPPVDASSAAAAKRMSLIGGPARHMAGADPGSKRMSLAGPSRAGAAGAMGSGSSTGAAGQKRPAAASVSVTGHAAKRLRPQ